MAFLGAVFWSSSGILSKVLMESGMTPFSVATFRLVSASLILFPVLCLVKTSVLRIGLRDVPTLAICGLAGVAVPVVLYFFTVNLTSASVAVVLLYTSPVFTLVISRLTMDERITQTKILAVLLVIAGCVLAAGAYSSKSIRLNALGLITGLGAGLTGALYNVIGKAALRKYDQMTVTAYSIGFGALFLTIHELALSNALVSNNPKIWILIVLLGLLPTVLAYTFFTTGLKYIEAGEASIISTAEIVSALFLAYVFLGESLALPQVMGVVFVILGVIILQKG